MSMRSMGNFSCFGQAGACWIVVLVALVSSVALPATAALNDADVAALTDIRGYWPALELLPANAWNGSAEEACTAWQGVGCSNDRVVSLTLVDIFINAHMAPSIGNLSALSILHLESCGLRGVISLNWSKLRGLVIINLSKNLFSLIQDSTNSLSTLVKLQEINLSRNRLISAIPNSLISLPDLRIMDFSANYFGGTIPTQLPPLIAHLDYGQNPYLKGTLPDIGLYPKLQSLSIANSPIDGILPSSLDMLDDLQFLNLANSMVTGTIPDDLGTCCEHQSEVYLNLGGTRISGTLPLSIANLTGLYVLNLLEMPLITGTIPSELFSLPHLNEFLLSNSAVTGSIPPIRAPSLTWFEMHGNKLLKGHVPHIEAPFLRWLQMSGCGLNGTLPPHLATLSDLIVLDLSFNDLEGDLGPLKYLVQNLSSVNLHQNPRFAAPLADFSIFTEAWIIDVAHTSCYGPDPLVNWFALPKLIWLDMSYTNMSGEIPLWSYIIHQRKALQHLDISGNHNITSPPLISAPATLSIKDEYHSTAEMLCHKIYLGATFDSNFNYPFALFDYAQCECEVGYFGSVPNYCIQCPSAVVSSCALGTNPALVPLGFYPVLNNTRKTFILEPCDFSIFEGVSNCQAGFVNVDRTGSLVHFKDEAQMVELPSNCRSGSFGRECGSCNCSSTRASCYYHNGFECLSCTDYNPLWIQITLISAISIIWCLFLFERYASYDSHFLKDLNLGHSRGQTSSAYQHRRQPWYPNYTKWGRPHRDRVTITEDMNRYYAKGYPGVRRHWLILFRMGIPRIYLRFVQVFATITPFKHLAGMPILRFFNLQLRGVGLECWSITRSFKRADVRSLWELILLPLLVLGLVFSLNLIVYTFFILKNYRSLRRPSDAPSKLDANGSPPASNPRSITIWFFHFPVFRDLTFSNFTFWINILLPGVLFSAIQLYIRDVQAFTQFIYSWDYPGIPYYSAEMIRARRYAFGIFVFGILWFLSCAARLLYMKIKFDGAVKDVPDVLDRVKRQAEEVVFARWNSALISPFRRGTSGWTLVHLIRSTLISLVVAAVPLWTLESNTALGGAWDPTNGFSISRHIVVGTLLFFLALDTAVNPWRLSLATDNVSMDGVLPDQICERVSFMLLILTASWSSLTSDPSWNNAFQIIASSLALAYFLFCLAWCYITLNWDYPARRCKVKPCADDHYQSYFWNYAGTTPPIADLYHPDAKETLHKGVTAASTPTIRSHSATAAKRASMDGEVPRPSFGRTMRDWQSLSSADNSDVEYDEGVEICTCCGFRLAVQGSGGGPTTTGGSDGGDAARGNGVSLTTTQRGSSVPLVSGLLASEPPSAKRHLIPYRRSAAPTEEMLAEHGVYSPSVRNFVASRSPPPAEGYMRLETDEYAVPVPDQVPRVLPHPPRLTTADTTADAELQPLQPPDRRPNSLADSGGRVSAGPPRARIPFSTDVKLDEFDL